MAIPTLLVVMSKLNCNLDSYNNMSFHLVSKNKNKIVIVFLALEIAGNLKIIYLQDISNENQNYFFTSLSR